MRFKDIGIKIKQYFSWIGSIGNLPEDNAELISHKAILTIATYATILNLVYFAYEYTLMERLTAAITLEIYVVYSLVNLILFRIHRNFKIFRDIFFIGWYVYFVIYHTVMGGYIGSVAYIYYGITVLMGVQMFYIKAFEKNAWFIIYIVTAIILYFLEPIISKNVVLLSNEIILLTIINNFVLIASLAFLSLNYYNKIIRKEKEKSDALIRNILPESVVHELNTQGISNPIMVPRATAIFMDFVGFTRITQKMGPQELVTILNEYFTSFDQIFLDHNVEKLKTIGDGYMAVGGLPVTNNSHPLDVALAAMSILLYMENKKKDKDIDWDIRIGIHTGPMVAGIIGETKFSYDVWGGSINLCSRLETSSKPGFINVSHEFMESTKEFFEFESRGFMEIKNREPVRMYFLIDIKEHLKLERFIPNDKFHELYKEYAKYLSMTIKFKP